MKTSGIPELKGGQMITLLYIAGFGILLFVVYRILGKMGLVTTKEKRQKEAAVENLRGVDEFSTQYLKDRTDKYVPLGNIGKQYARDLHDAIKGIGTNEEDIYRIFNLLKNRENISEIAVYYKVLYNSELLTDILNDLNDKEKAILMGIINKLPAK